MTSESTLEQPGVEVSAAVPTPSGPVYRPTVDIVAGTEELLVRADLPGVAREDIDVNFEDGMLSIHARVRPRQTETTSYLLREYGVGGFYRAFRLGEEIDPSRISAQYAAGVLTLHLPKSEAAKSRKVAVN